MVLLHHEVEVDFQDDNRPTKKHRATLLEFGRNDQDGKTTTSMALTVGIPAAIGALVSINYPSVLFIYPTPIKRLILRYFWDYFCL